MNTLARLTVPAQMLLAAACALVVATTALPIRLMAQPLNEAADEAYLAETACADHSPCGGQDVQPMAAPDAELGRRVRWHPDPL